MTKQDMGETASSSQQVVVTATIVIVIATTLFILYRKRSSSGSSKGAKKTLVDDQTKYALPLIEKITVSHDTRKFRFGLPSAEHVLGLPTGQHVYVSAKIDGKLVVRPYTPTSSDEDKGYLELMIKVYFPKVNERFPDGGKMSYHLENLKIGDTMDFRGPSGKIVYRGRGTFDVKADNKSPACAQHYSRMGMIAGGTGVTPMLQIITAVLRDENDHTKMHLLFANQTEDDILCREELDKLAAQHPDRFKVYYTLDRPTEGWKGFTGFINEDKLKEAMPEASDATVILMCGPPPMINFACTPNLDKLGYKNRLTF